MKIDSQEILSFWFGAWPFNADAVKQQAKLWFSSTTEMDQLISHRFKPQIDAALNGTLAVGCVIDEQLALILLTDQFTRNVFRKTPEAFSGDQIALDACLALIEKGQHLTLPPPVASFACMPLQHSEDKNIQAKSIAVFNAIAEHSPETFQEAARGYAKYAKLHEEIISEFGRFPHRNAALNRTSTEAEQAYLDGDGHRFGQ